MLSAPIRKASLDLYVIRGSTRAGTCIGFQGFKSYLKARDKVPKTLKDLLVTLLTGSIYGVGVIEQIKTTKSRNSIVNEVCSYCA
jgi:hypothetical protein